MYSAMGVEPTKLTACTRLSSRRVSTASLSPCTTLNTPSGRPASLSRRAISSDGEGSRSEGLSTKLLPQASARSEEHTSELQSLMRISYAVFCLKQKKDTDRINDRARIRTSLHYQNT